MGTSARFLATQAHAIGGSESALVRYRGALAELAEANAAATALRDVRLAGVERAFAAGETDASTIALLQADVAAASRARLDALRRAHEALGALEDAVQRPLGPDEAFAASAKETPR